MQLKKRLFLNLFPADVLRKLLLIDVFLALLSLIATVFIHQYETRLEQALWILSTNEESSLPTWYASIKLLGCALFIYLIYRQKSREEDRFTLHWKMLFGIMLYISIDEIATFRENIAIVLYPVINGTGIFAHNWVLIVLPIVFVTAIFYSSCPQKPNACLSPLACCLSAEPWVLKWRLPFSRACMTTTLASGEPRRL